MNRLTFVGFCLLCFQSNLMAAVPASERDALIALYNSTNVPGWTTNTNWLIGDPCTDGWYGVTCGSGANITEIRLSRNLLDGTIAAELGNLVKLDILDLSRNLLSGTIPKELGSLANLQELHLESASLDGPIPPELGKLTYLQFLGMSFNSLAGRSRLNWAI